MLRMTLRQLSYFVEAAETGSLVEAARALNVTQPTVTSGLHTMEDALGVELFIRHHAQGVSLTPTGRLLLPNAQFLLNRAKDFQAEAQARAAEHAGDLTIGCYTPLAAVFMPAIIAEFSARLPKVNLSFVDGSVEDLTARLESGELDLALMYETGLPTTLKCTSVKEGRPYVVLPKGHPKLASRNLELEDLIDEPFVLLDTLPAREYLMGRQCQCKIA